MAPVLKEIEMKEPSLNFLRFKSSNAPTLRDKVSYGLDLKT